MNRNSFAAVLVALVALARRSPRRRSPQSLKTSPRRSTTNSWYFFNGACLTAGSATGVEPRPPAPGRLPGCTTIASSYYNKTAGEVLVGGYNGRSRTPPMLPDPAGNGALRFTNGYPYGYNENGGIVSTAPFPTGQGVSITFKTVTYLGNSGGGGGTARTASASS